MGGRFKQGVCPSSPRELLSLDGRVSLAVNCADSTTLSGYMADDHNSGLSIWPDLIEKIRARTPARVLADRSGAAYRTATQLQLRHDHAAARDAVRTEFDLTKRSGRGVCGAMETFRVSTMAASKEEYLRRPDLGRRLIESARSCLAAHCALNADLQIVIGDGLSVTAVSTQLPPLLPMLAEKAQLRGWTLGRLSQSSIAALA